MNKKGDLSWEIIVSAIIIIILLIVVVIFFRQQIMDVAKGFGKVADSGTAGIDEIDVNKMVGEGSKTFSRNFIYTS